MKIVTIEARISEAGENYFCLDRHFEGAGLEDRRIHSEIDLTDLGLKTGDRIRYHVLMRDVGESYGIAGEMIEVIKDEKGGSVLRSAKSRGWEEGFRDGKKK